MPPEGYPQVDILTEEVREEIEYDYQEHLILYKRAKNIINLYSKWVNEDQLDKIKEFKKNSFKNLASFGRLSKFCYDHPFLGACLKRKDEIYKILLKVDSEVLEFEAVKDKF